MSILNMTFLFFLASCSILKTPQTLETKDKEQLLEAVRLTGEGKGRLTFDQSQYVFNFESVLKENYDWILAVSIPLQGEEVMIFKNLQKKEVKDPNIESFEVRITNEFHKAKLDKTITPDNFLRELRVLVRFILAKQWGGKQYCQEQQEEMICEFEGEKFKLSTHKGQLNISKSLNKGNLLVLEAKILKEQFFERTDIRLKSPQQSSSALSLELFWQD